MDAVLTLGKKRTNSQKLPFILVISIVVVSALLVMRDIMGMSIGKMSFVAVILLSCVLMNYRFVISFLFFLLPILNGLPGNYILPIIAITLLIKRKSLMSRKAYLFFFLLAFFESIHFPFYNFPINFPLTIGYLSALFLMCYVISANDPTLDYKRCLLLFCIGNALFLLIILGISSQYGGSAASILEEGNRMGETKTLTESLDGELMINANPNGLGAFAIVGASIVLVLFKTKHLKVLPMTIFLTIFLSVGSMSVSRTFYVCLALMLVLVVFSRQGNKKYGGRFFNYLVTIGILAAILYLILGNDLILNVILDRFTADDVITGSGRTEIMAMYHNWLMDNPVYLIFGTGSVHYQQVAQLPSACHNAIQQVMVAYGIIGLLLFSFLVYSGIKRCYTRKNFVYLIPFIVVFISVQASRVLNPWNNLYLFFAVFYVMKMGQLDTYTIDT